MLDNTGERELDSIDIENLRNLDECRAAVIYDARIRVLERRSKTTFCELGLILVEMELRALWSKLSDPDTGCKYTSMGQWLIATAPCSRSNAYAAMGAIKELADVPIESLREMPRSNIEVMRKLSSSVRKQPAVIEAAQTESEEGFTDKIRKDFPEQHLPKVDKLVLNPSSDLKALIEEGFEAIGWTYDSKSKEEALELLVCFFFDGMSEKEGYSHLTNRQAFATAKGTV